MYLSNDAKDDKAIEVRPWDLPNSFMPPLKVGGHMKQKMTRLECILGIEQLQAAKSEVNIENCFCKIHTRLLLTGSRRPEPKMWRQYL